jgi:type IV secretory pathway TraG/TraD family ATPase VirD4
LGLTKPPEKSSGSGKTRNRSGLVIGGAGLGKDRDVTTGYVLDADEDSLICVMPKGGGCAITQRHRASLGPVNILNPCEVDEGVFPMKLSPSKRYNVMAALKKGFPSFMLGCSRLARSMSGNHRTNDENSAHFRDKAVSLLAGCIGYVGEIAPAPDRNLVTVRNASIYVQQKFGGLARAFARESDSKEVDGIISTATRYTEFIGNEVIGLSVTGHDFRFATHKQRIETTYIILPLEYLETCSEWFSLIVASAMNELLRGGPGRRHVRFVLDEFPLYANDMWHGR